MDRSFLLIGAVINLLGVAAGAFGAHALRGRLSADMLAVFETGVRYQMYHGLAILFVALAIGHFGMHACCSFPAGRLLPASFSFPAAFMLYL